MTLNKSRYLEKLHQEAMSFCDQALAARRKRDYALVKSLFREAFKHEQEAANLVAADYTLEPSRSVLHRSAAALAIECGELRAAEKLIAMGLAGDPPLEIAEELRDVLEQVNLGRHLELRGLELAPDELQMSIEGKATGHGMAQSDEFVDRVQTSEKLLFRTIERKMGRPFRETGKAIKEITRNFELYLSVPRAASFAVTLRVGLPQKQLVFPNMEQDILNEPGKIIDDLLECLETFDANDQERLKVLIPDEIYRRNFIGLAERLAPDGEQVRVVGLTVLRQGEERRVALIKKHREPRAIRPTDETSIEIIGRLLFANATSVRKKIKIVSDDGVAHSLDVPEGMMADIVRPLWEDEVRVQGKKRGDTIHLEHIESYIDQAQEVES
ncbi:MAG: hypothetical protein ACLQGP_36880 [Isosphaeraceae bacterium]